jgi:hypothetical protein
MSDRKCVKCRRPCAGHVGQTGVNCILTPLVYSDDKEDRPEGFGFVTKTEGADGGIADVSQKLDKLTSHFERLMTTVGNLADRVDKSETTISEALKASSATVSTDILNAEKAKQLEAERLLKLPKPSWNSAAVVKAEAPVNTQSLARDIELSKLLDEYNKDGADDLLRAQDAVNARDLGVVKHGEQRAKKPLLIPDFVTSCLGISHDQEDIELLTSKGPSFKLQGRTKKLEAKDISVAQWVSANIAILEQLMPTLSSQELRDYLYYTRQIGDFF